MYWIVFYVFIENAQSIGKLLKHLIFGKIPYNNPFQKRAKFLIFYEGHDFLASVVIKMKY